MPIRQQSKRKARYAIDAFNRLVVLDPDDPLHPKRIFEGRFSIQNHNKLAYVFSKAGAALPEGGRETIALDGTWKLTGGHELALALHESKDRHSQTLTLKGALVQAEANGLVFALRQDADDAIFSQRLTLSGRWAADAQNRLTFLVEKAQGAQDRLTLQGGWEVGPHHELFYRYRQLINRRRFSEERALIFDGSWDIARNGRLVYRLLGTDTSMFEFRASLQSSSIRAAEGRIAYQAGIGLSQGRSQKQRVVLFGAWKINRDLSVSLEIPYAEGRVGSLRCETAAALNRRDSVTVALANDRRQKLGIAVTFTRKLNQDANLFLRLKRSSEESSVLGGVQVRF